MSIEEETVIHETDRFLPRNINSVEMAVLRDLFAQEGWKLMSKLLRDKEIQQIRVGMGLRNPPEVREQARAMYAGLRWFSELPGMLDEVVHPEEME